MSQAKKGRPSSNRPAAVIAPRSVPKLTVLAIKSTDAQKRALVSDNACESSLPCHYLCASHASTDFLNSDYRREGKQCFPKLSISELGACLRISTDARWIIIRRACEESWTERFQVNSQFPKRSAPSDFVFSFCSFGCGHEAVFPADSLENIGIVLADKVPAS